MLGLTARLSLSLAGLVMMAAAILSPARAVESPTMRTADLTYDVYLGGLHIFTFDISMTLQPQRYRVTAAGGTRGVIGLLYGWDMRLAAEGVDDNGSIAPLRYVAETDWQRNARTL